MLFKRRTADRCDAVRRVRFAVDERLLALDERFFFQGFQMRGEVAVGHIQEVLQRAEIQVVVHHERRHDSQSDPALERLVQLVEIDTHRSTFTWT